MADIGLWVDRLHACGLCSGWGLRGRMRRRCIDARAAFGGGLKPPQVKRPEPARSPGFSPEWAGGPTRTRWAVPAWGSRLQAPHPVSSTAGQELETLRERLKAFEGAKPAVQLDPAQVRPSK